MAKLLMSRPSVLDQNTMSARASLIHDGATLGHIDMEESNVFDFRSRARTWLVNNFEEFEPTLDSWVVTGFGGLELDVQPVRQGFVGDDLYWYGALLGDLKHGADVRRVLRERQVTIGNVQGIMGAEPGSADYKERGFWRIQTGYDADGDRIVAFHTGEKWVFIYATCNPEDQDTYYGIDGTNSNWSVLGDNTSIMFTEAPNVERTFNDFLISKGYTQHGA